jgi:hypothetical protein
MKKSKIDSLKFITLVPLVECYMFWWVISFCSSKNFLLSIFGLCMLQQGIYGNSDLILESDQPISLSDGNKTILARGNASLKGEDFLVLADEISWSRESGDAFASGKVSVTKGSSRILADYLHLNTGTGDYIARNARGGTPPRYFLAEKLENNGSIETYSNGILYMSEPGLFEPNIRAKKYTVDFNQSTFTISPSQVRIGNIIIGILPGFSGKKRSGLGGISSAIKTGKDGTLGWYAEAGFEYRWEDLSAGADLTYYQDRGWFLSPRIAHSKTLEEGYINSQLKGGWVKDTASYRGKDSRNSPIKQHRGYAHFTNLSRFSNDIRSSTVVEWENDSEVIRDFRRQQFYSNQWNQSHNEISYEGNGYTVSVFTRWQTNSHESIVEQLPLFSMDAGPINQWNVYHSGTLSYGSLIKRDEFGFREPSIERMNLGYKIEKPLALAKGLTLNPSVALLHQDYRLSTGSVNRSFGEYGLDLHANSYQEIPYSNKLWEIDRMLHVMKTSISFRTTEEISSKNPERVPEINALVEDLNLAPLDILDHKDSEIISEKQLVRFGWENSILAKWDDQSRKLLSMRAYYDLYNSKTNSQEDADSLYADLSIHPIYWLSLNLRHKVDLNSGKNYRKSYGISLKDGRFQGASLTYLSYLNFNNYTYLSGWKRLNEKLYGSLGALYDLDQNFLTYWNGRLEYRTGSSWVWDFTMTQRKGTSRENHTEFSIGLSLSGFKLNRLTQPDGLSSLYAM